MQSAELAIFGTDFNRASRPAFERNFSGGQTADVVKSAPKVGFKQFFAKKAWGFGNAILEALGAPPPMDDRVRHSIAYPAIRNPKPLTYEAVAVSPSELLASGGSTRLRRPVTTPKAEEPESKPEIKPEPIPEPVQLKIEPKRFNQDIAKEALLVGATVAVCVTAGFLARNYLLRSK